MNKVQLLEQWYNLHTMYEEVVEQENQDNKDNYEFSTFLINELVQARMLFEKYEKCEYYEVEDRGVEKVAQMLSTLYEEDANLFCVIKSDEDYEKEEAVEDLKWFAASVDSEPNKVVTYEDANKVFWQEFNDIAPEEEIVNIELLSNEEIDNIGTNAVLSQAIFDDQCDGELVSVLMDYGYEFNDIIYKLRLYDGELVNTLMDYGYKSNDIIHKLDFVDVSGDIHDAITSFMEL